MALESPRLSYMWTLDKLLLLSGTTEMSTSREYLNTLAAQQDLNWDGVEELDEDEVPPQKEEDYAASTDRASNRTPR